MEDKSYVVKRINRSDIIDHMNDVLATSESKTELKFDDERITDALCEKYAAQINHIQVMDNEDGDAEFSFVRDLLTNDVGIDDIDE